MPPAQRQPVRAVDQARQRVLEALRIAPRPVARPGFAAQHLARAQAVLGDVEGDRALDAGHRRQRGGQGAGGLHARHPAAAPSEGAARQRQVLRQRHQQHRVARLDAVCGQPVEGGSGDAVPGGCRGIAEIKGQESYLGHSVVRALPGPGKGGFMSE